MKKRSILLNGMAVVTAVVAVLFIAAEPDHGDVHIEKEHWSFQGFFGKFDHAQLRRGFTVYKDVCSACHSMDLMAYRNLQTIGERCRRDVRAAGQGLRRLQGPVPQRAGRARRQQRRSPARPIADRALARRQGLPRL
jgi:hypothetical protein